MRAIDPRDTRSKVSSAIVIEDRTAMIQNWDKFRQFEQRLIASEPADFERNLRLAEDLYHHARALGRFPGPEPLEGVEINIRLVRVFRSVQGTS